MSQRMLFKVDTGYGLPFAFVVADSLREAVLFATAQWPEWRTIYVESAELWLASAPAEALVSATTERLEASRGFIDSLSALNQAISSIQERSGPESR